MAEGGGRSDQTRPITASSWKESFTKLAAQMDNLGEEDE
jgi:hypothetical protein